MTFPILLNIHSPHQFRDFGNDDSISSISYFFTLWHFNPNFIQSLAVSIGFMILFFAISHLVLQLYSFQKWFRNFNHETQQAWVNRVVSSIHAVMVAIYLTMVFYFNYESYFGSLASRESRFYFRIGSHQLGILFTMGYFLWDLIFLYFNPAERSTAILSHHFGGLMVAAYMKVTGMSFTYLGMSLISEWTTPWINYRWFLAVRKNKGMAYYITIAVIWVKWVVIRVGIQTITTGYFFFIDVMDSFHISELEGYKTSFVAIFYALGVILNVYWFLLITLAIIRGINAHVTTKSGKDAKIE